jgi:hypothetical protein
MFSAIIAAITTIGGGLITAYNKSKDVSIAAIQSSVGIAQAQVHAMSLWIGHPLSPPSIMAYGVAIWFFKATACDKVIGPALGYRWSTDPISGETAVIAGLVVAGMFSAGVVGIIKRGLQ